MGYIYLAYRGTRNGLDRERAGVSGASPQLRDAGTGLARHDRAQGRSRKMDLRKELEFFAVEENAPLLYTPPWPN